ncbi:helicase-associated domain-containing protein [Sanguibacter antarcticus]|nr:helicase-associated domain-containing protein [Sanguibacter antarcticus]
MATFSDSIRARSDEHLVALLTHRPDLASPSPATLLSLAARATSRASLQRATNALDAAHLEVLESVTVLESLGEHITADRVVAAITGTAHDDDAAAVRAILTTLDEMALVWSPDGTALRPAPGVDEVQDAYPGGLGPIGRTQDAVPDPDLLKDAPPGARSILSALTWGPPIGRIPTVAGAPAAAPTRWLVQNGFVKQADAQHVVLPRRVAMALRGGRTHQRLSRAPSEAAAGPSQRAPETVAAESVRAAQEAVRLLAELISTWQVAPPSVLKSGGLGVRDLRRLAARLEVNDRTAALVTELALVAGLVVDDGDDPASYSPTLDADDWLAADVPSRWAALVTAWFATARAPWLVGSRDERGALRNALEPELHRAWVPRLRGEVLDVLAEAPLTPLSPDDVLAVLRWRTPRSVPPIDAVAALLGEAEMLGVTGAGALAPGGAVLADVPRQTVPDDGVVVRLTTCLTELLPEAVDEILLQGDLTGVVPGRPSPALEALLADSADVESRGAAITVRFTPTSVTRSLDAGRTGEEFLAELALHSRTPVPQPLEYLVRDAARRHGQVRLGVASSYVRVEDPTLLAGLIDDQRLRPLGLFRIAPTVLAATAPIGQLLAALRERGMAPAMEGPDGQIVLADRRTPRVRVPARRSRRPGSGPGARPGVRLPDRSAVARTGRDDRAARLATLVAALRRDTPAAGAQPRVDEGSASDGPSDDPGTGRARGAGEYRHRDSVRGSALPGTTEPVVALGMLREAAADGREVWLDMTGPVGEHQRRRVRPLRVDAGRLRAVDVARESELTVAVHRIISVELVPVET